MSIKSIIRNHLPIKSKWPRWLLTIAVRKRFKEAMGYELDLDNPLTFNEKIQWYKLFYENEEISRITDKYLFKSYVAEKLGSDKYTIPLLGHWYKSNELLKDWKNLPEEFVLKSNLSYNGNNMKFITNKSAVDIDDVINEVKTWLDPRNTMMNTCCCRFNHSTPCILAEVFLKEEGHTPNDYKFFCFDGEPYYVYAATAHFEKGMSAISFYDLKWNMLNVKYADYLTAKVDKPKQFNQMLDIARKLSSGFPFVRVDFFNVADRVYLSELTFDSGDGHRKFDPVSFDKEMGQLFHIGINH